MSGHVCVTPMAANRRRWVLRTPDTHAMPTDKVSLPDIGAQGGASFVVGTVLMSVSHASLCETGPRRTLALMQLLLCVSLAATQNFNGRDSAARNYGDKAEALSGGDWLCDGGPVGAATVAAMWEIRVPTDGGCQLGRARAAE